MRERVTHVTVVAQAALLESLRRRDLYVVGLLALFGLLAGTVLARSGVRGQETFLRDTFLMLVNFLSVAVCIWLAARQVPEELARRTLFPLLARPVRREDILLGKFLAVWAVSVIGLLLLAALAWLALAMLGAPIGPIYLQYVVLRALSFGPIAALTMALSLLATPAATAVLAGMLTLCGTLFARTLAEAVSPASGAWRLVLQGLYFAVPHLDLFDLSQRTAYNYPPVPAWVLGTLAGYALLYVAAFLGLGTLRFRRLSL